MSDWPARAHKVRIPIYNSWVIFTTDEETARETHAAMGIEEPKRVNGQALSTQHMETGTALILIHVYNGELETLVHECVHAAYYLLAEYGVGHDTGNHEALAYMVSFLVEELQPLLPARYEG